MNNIQNEAQAINHAFDRAFNNKDVNAIGALYDVNAVVMPAPAGEAVAGIEAIKAFFSGLIEAGVIEHQLTFIDAVEDGNMAFQRGLWAAGMIDAHGNKQSFGGNVHLVYKKQVDGDWKAVTHIWN